MLIFCYTTRNYVRIDILYEVLLKFVFYEFWCNQMDYTLRAVQQRIEESFDAEIFKHRNLFLLVFFQIRKLAQCFSSSISSCRLIISFGFISHGSIILYKLWLKISWKSWWSLNPRKNRPFPFQPLIWSAFILWWWDFNPIR